MILYRVDTLAPLPAAGSGLMEDSSEIALSALRVLPSQLPPTPEELALENPLQVSLAPGIELLGYELGAGASPGRELPLKLWWRVTEPLTVTYQAHLMLQDAVGRLRAEQVVELASAEYPTSQWTRGEVVEGRYSLPISAEAMAGQALLGVELLLPDGVAREPVRVAAVDLSEPVHLFQPPAIQHLRKETLGEVVRLLGYDLEPEVAAPGETIELTLYWQDLAPLQSSYTVFTHLLDRSGTMVAGHDALPANGTYPTTGWVLHEVIIDGHLIVVPTDAPPGEYCLEVGLYDAATGARLPAFDATGAHLSQDRILLGTIEVH